MKETPILMQTEMVKAILDGRKTQTRRVIKPQPIDGIFELKEHSCVTGYWIPYARDKRLVNNNAGSRKDDCGYYCPYGQAGDRLYCRHNYYLLDEYLLGKSDSLYRLTDDRIYAILTMEVQDGRYKTDEWCPSQAYPNLPQRGLHGGVGWSNLLTNKIQRLWAEGIRGLVSASRTQQWEGLSSNIDEPQQSQSNQECSPSDMYGFSWDATLPILSDQTFRWEWTKQFTKQFSMGNAGRKLDGQESTRQGKRGGEAPNGKVDKLSNGSPQMGNRNRVSEPTESKQNTWDVAGWHLRSCPSEVLRLKPSIHMPRWASRITLEITGIRVERVQEITITDALDEGCGTVLGHHIPQSFVSVWDSLNAKRGYSWESNPWVWVIEFRNEGGE